MSERIGGLNTLSTQIDSITRRLSTIESMALITQTSLASSIKSIANSLSQAEKDAALDNLFTQYQTGLTDANIDPAHETFEDLGKLITFSIDFVEKHAPSFTQLVDTVVADNSQFKLQSCIKLIFLVLPPTLYLAEGLLMSLINEVVRLKNKSSKKSWLRKKLGA